MDKIKKIINSNWINAAAAGFVALGFAFYGNWFASGISLGFGLKCFISVFQTKECECDCKSCKQCDN